MTASRQPRLEDIRLVQGKGLFVADRIAADTLHAGFVRADMASARITGLDTTEALAMPGVVAVVTGADLAGNGVPDLPHAPMPRDDGGTPGHYPQPILSRDLIRHVGEPIALVVAESRAALLAALERVLVETDEAAAPEGLAWVKSIGDRPAAEAALAKATHVHSARLSIPRVTAMALEPRGAIATPTAEGGLHYVSSTQNPFALRAQLAEHFGWDPAGLHIQAQDVGGSFGLKGYMTREDAALCWAARRIGRSVCWISTRSEAMVADAQGRGCTAEVTVGFDAAYRLLAIRAEFAVDAGAYPDRRAMGLINNMNGLTGMYDLPILAAEVRGLLSARAPLAPFRGNGRPEVTMTLERVLDGAASAMGVDPLDLRRRNLLVPSRLPVVTPTGATIDCGDFPRVMAAAMELAKGSDTRRKAVEARGRLYGMGLANCIESAGGPIRAPKPDFARLTVDADGLLRLAPGVMSVGQGHETALSVMAAQRLQIPLERVVYVNGDTSAVVNGRGSGGSSGLSVAGSAVAEALDRMIAEGTELAAGTLNVAASEIVFRDGAFFHAAGNASVTLEQIAKGQPGGQWTVEASFTPPQATYPNGSHVCEVEIDPETGETRVLRYAAVEDVGRVLNPALVEGQLHGGIAQGLSIGLGERVVHDDHDQVLTGSLMDYQVVRADELPFFELKNVEVATASNPLGVKGVGEAGTVGSTAAFAAAVRDALGAAGVEDFDLPATPCRVWQALHAVGAA